MLVVVVIAEILFPLKLRYLENLDAGVSGAWDGSIACDMASEPSEGLPLPLLPFAIRLGGSLRALSVIR